MSSDSERSNDNISEDDTEDSLGEDESEDDSNEDESEDDSSEDEDNEVVVTSLDRKMESKNIIDIANWKFGGGCYESIQRHGRKRGSKTYIAHRGLRSASSICLDSNRFSTDPELIRNFLSTISHYQLNRVDEKTGESLLHIAAKYNRAGIINERHNTGHQYDLPLSMLPHENIVKWLLQNPSFTHVLSQDINGCTAFHAALGAHIPRNYLYSLEFYSENHGGYFGQYFVAHCALRTLLEDSFYCRCALNVTNKEKLSPLAYVMEKSVERIERQRCYTTLNCEGKPRSFSQCKDGSIEEFATDYPLAIEKILESPHLRLHGMFGVNNSHGLPFARPRFCSLASLEPSKELLALRYFCYGGGRLTLDDETFDSQDVPGHSNLLQSLLSSNIGALDGNVKAQVLATTITHNSSSYITEYCWAFDPTTFSDKSIQKVLRRFFVKHAKECIQAVYALQDELIREACHLLLLPHRNRIQNAMRIDTDSWKEILQFADWRAFVTPEWHCLKAMMQVLESKVLSFFLGGILSCFERVFCLPKDALEKILQYSGWKRSFPQLDLVVSRPIIPVSRSNRKKRKRNNRDVEES